MNLKVDWVVDTLLRQVELLAQREGRRPAAARLCVPAPDGAPVALALKDRLPEVELEVLEREGRPRVLMVSFSLDGE